MRTVAVVTALILSGLTLAGCAGEDAPRIERLDTAAATPVTIMSWSIQGQRDGASTRAATIWDLAGGEQLHVEMVFAYDPNPVLAEGRWLSSSGGGTLQAEAVRFVGGQGEGPSVGGRFLLVDDGIPRYRLHLPLTRIETAAPRP